MVVAEDVAWKRHPLELRVSPRVSLVQSVGINQRLAVLTAELMV